VWAGVVPVRSHLGDPEPDARVLPQAGALELSRFALRGVRRTRR
jgi:hypothetical protein